MITGSELTALIRACRRLPHGPDYRESDYVRNLLITALDFQLRVETVNAAIAWYDKNHGKSIRSHGDLKRFLRRFPNTRAGSLRASRELWGNNCWTRIQFLRTLLDYFDKQDVADMRGLRKWARKSDFRKDVAGRVRSRRHIHSMGPAIYHWLLLRVGVPTVKPDLHVQRFVERAIGKRPSPEETVAAVVQVARKLNRQPHEIDAAIWHDQREKLLTSDE